MKQMIEDLKYPKTKELIGGIIFLISIFMCYYFSILIFN